MADAIVKQNLLDTINALSLDGELSQADVNYLMNWIIANGDMSGSPRDLIQIRRGNKADLPNLAQGEMAVTLDTEELFIGGLGGNVDILFNVKKQLENVFVNLLSYGADPLGVYDSTDALKNAIATGKPVMVPSGTYIINPFVTTSNIQMIAVGNPTFKVIQATPYVIETSGTVSVDGKIIFDGDNKVTTSLFYQTTGKMPRFKGCTFKNMACSYTMLPDVVTTVNDIGYIHEVSFLNVNEGFFINGPYNNWINAYGEILVSNCYWDSECGSAFHVLRIKSAIYSNLDINSNPTKDATDGPNFGYVLDNVIATNVKINGGKRGITTGKISKHINVSNNQVKNVVGNGIQIDSRVGHIDNTVNLNVIGTWDVSTGTSPVSLFPTAVKGDTIKVSVGGVWNNWTYYPGDLVIFNPDDLQFGSGWFVDFPECNGIVANNSIHTLSTGRALYIQASGVKITNNNIKQDGTTIPVRINGGVRVEIYDNTIYLPTNNDTTVFIHAARSASVVADRNIFMNLNGGNALRSYQYFAETGAIIHVGKYRIITNPASGANVYLGNDKRVLISANATFNLRLPAATAVQNIVNVIEIYRTDVNPVVINLNTDGGNGTINGLTSFTIGAGRSLIAICVGDDVWTVYEIERAATRYGVTASRPTNAPPWFNYVDTTLNKPIWYNGVAWIDASGTVV